MIAHKGVFVGNVQLVGEAERRVVPRVGNRHDDVGLRGKPSGQLASHLGADFRNVDAAHDAIGPCEINVLKHAERLLLVTERPLRTDAIVADDHDFAGFYFANKFRVHEIERTSLRRQNVSAIELAEHEWPEAKRIAHADDLSLAHNNKAERALETPKDTQRRAAVLRRLRKKVRNDFAVGRRLEDGTFLFQLVAQDGGVDQVPIMRDGDLAAETIDHERLRVFQRARARGGITRVSQSACPFQALELGRAENL